MDPTQDQTDMRKLMASIKEALDKIVAEFSLERQGALRAPALRSKP